MATTTAAPSGRDERDGATGRRSNGRLLMHGAAWTWVAGTMLATVLEWPDGYLLYVPAGLLLALWTAPRRG